MKESIANITKDQNASDDEFTIEERSAINARLDKALSSKNWHKVDSDHWAKEHKRLDELAKKSDK